MLKVKAHRNCTVMPINGVIGISAEREMDCQLFMVTVTIMTAFMGPPPARRARAPVGHPSGQRRLRRLGCGH